MAKKKSVHASKSMSQKTNTAANFSYIEGLEQYFHMSADSFADKVAAFPKYVPRQRLTDFLSRYEIFKHVLNVQGSVIDCGVYKGKSLMTYAQLSAILEPMNYQRKIIGFESFRGYLRLSEKDSKGTHEENRVGGLRADAAEDIQKGVALYDQNRFLNHIPKVELVTGDIVKTAPRYLEAHPHLIVSLLNLDVNLYEPTKTALKIFVPRMPKGAVIAFSEMNCPDFSGEVPALLEELGINSLRIQRNPFDTVASYAILE